jgi:hypothetical protein
VSKTGRAAGDAGNRGGKLFAPTIEKELHIWVEYDDYPIAIRQPRPVGPFSDPPKVAGDHARQCLARPAEWGELPLFASRQQRPFGQVSRYRYCGPAGDRWEVNKKDSRETAGNPKNDPRRQRRVRRRQK